MIINAYIIRGFDVCKIQDIVESIRQTKNFHILRNCRRQIRIVNGLDSTYYHEWMIIIKNRKCFEEFDKVKEYLIKKHNINKNHIISVNESEMVPHLKIYFNDINDGFFHNLDNYKTFFNHELYIPFYCQKEQIEEAQMVEVNIDNLVCKPLGCKEPITLEESPHYQYICGDKQPYINYINKRWEVGDIGRGHSKEQFDKLIENFDFNYLDKDGKKCPILIWRKDQIIDGVHRAALLKFKGVRKVTCLKM